MRKKIWEKKTLEKIQEKLRKKIRENIWTKLLEKYEKNGGKSFNQKKRRKRKSVESWKMRKTWRKIWKVVPQNLMYYGFSKWQINFIFHSYRPGKSNFVMDFSLNFTLNFWVFYHVKCTPSQSCWCSFNSCNENYFWRQNSNKTFLMYTCKK